MDQKPFGLNHLQHPQSMYDNQLRVPDGPSLANHFVFRSLFEGDGRVAPEKLMHHLQQQQQQQQQQYRDDPMAMIHGGGGHVNYDQPQNLHKSNLTPPTPQEQIYTCPENGCNKTFTHKGSFTIHFNNHRKKNSPNRNPNPSPATHQCPDCEKRYRSQCGLYWHEQTIHKKRVFNCTECNKIFKSYCGFYVHRKSHQGGNSYECNICYKTFSQKGSLKTHLKIHTGDHNESGGGGGGARDVN